MNERLRNIFGRQTEVTQKGDIIRTVERTALGIALDGALHKGVQLGKGASIGALRLGKDASIGALRLGKDATVRAAVRTVRDLNEVRGRISWGEIGRNYTVQNFVVIGLVCLIANERGYFDTPEAQRIFSWARSLLPAPETIIYQERPAPPTWFHKVTPGQTLTEISQLSGVSVEKIAQANGIENIDKIPQGLIIAIPLQDWIFKPFEVEPPEGIYSLPWELNSNPDKIWGLAHYYGAGEPLNENTASGELFNPNAITAASWFYEMGRIVRVTNLFTGMSVDVRINDRGPDRLWEYGEDEVRKNVVIDLTHAAFRMIEPYDHKVLVEVTLLPD